jgi:hypothetical protein
VVGELQDLAPLGWRADQGREIENKIVTLQLDRPFEDSASPMAVKVVHSLVDGIPAENGFSLCLMRSPLVDDAQPANCLFVECPLRPGEPSLR